MADADGPMLLLVGPLRKDWGVDLFHPRPFLLPLVMGKCYWFSNRQLLPGFALESSVVEFILLLVLAIFVNGVRVLSAQLLVVALSDNPNSFKINKLV